MSNTDKYLYYKQDLYYILKEDTNNYYLQRYNNIFIQTHKTPIHFKPETDDDYYMFLQYDCQYQYKYTKLFSKNQEDYIIFDDITCKSTPICFSRQLSELQNVFQIFLIL